VNFNFFAQLADVIMHGVIFTGVAFAAYICWRFIRS